ncbi:MAG: anti-sigma factor [Acidimicrobiales bacterium]
MTDDIHLLAGAYALDALDPDERRRYEAHYTDCELCVDEVAGFRATAAALAGAVADAPPPDLKARVMAEVARTRQDAPVVVPLARVRRGRTLLAVAASVIAVVVVVGAVLFGLDAGGERDDAVELASVLTAPDAVTTVLDGAVGDGTVRVVWSPERDAAVVVGAGLAAPGSGETYELWSLRGDEARPAGLFVPDEGGSVTALLEVAFDDSEAWGITIEPAGGSPSPTGEILYLAEVSRA